MVDRLFSLALIGGEPILYLLIILSFMSIAVVLERFIFYFRQRVDISFVTDKIIKHLNQRDIEKAKKAIDKFHGAEIEVVKEGLANFDKGTEVANELMESMAMKQQQDLDRWLIILGTIGSNAPFIGLLGTVLGIIKAFHDLATDMQGGPSVVMAGIAEALVATAVGLLVAIPAVVFFNYFKNRQKRIMSNIAQLERMLLAFMTETENGTLDSDTK